ncbi:cytochrome P450 [Streptomyces luteoverticillatus]|uniref:Cytochrome P450 n=1 Tax=Streptomyces luteoverticillatus TaxID=66425 RepID=A0A3S9PSC8_STRLT|nr:cytochrome P450 [Streptomyces luteoverticillatus]AZQ75223.1 cytochrome P450 [Streptomyces luteoverticillatus]
MSDTDRASCPHLAGAAPTVHELDADFTRDPFPELARLREAGPVHRVKLPNGTERWLITRYDEVMAALADPRLSNELARGLAKVLPPEPLPPSWQVALRTSALLGRAMANLDPPDHDRLRKLVVRAFSAKRIEGMRSRIQEITDELFDALAGQSEFDLVEAVSNQLPITVICELLGVPSSDADLFRTAARVLGGFVPDDEAARRTIEALDAFDAYVRSLVTARRAEPGPDLFSELAKVPEDGQGLTDDELVSMAGLLLFGGYETSAQLISSAVLSLLRHPDQLAAVRADSSLLAGAVDEVLRFEGPVNPGLNRYALEDVEIGGVTIPQGSYVVLGVAAANRDPRHWPEPDRFDVTRTATAKQLGFGYGLHYCIGARLAQLEVEITLATALHRYPKLRLAVPADELHWRAGSVRGVSELPLRVD